MLKGKIENISYKTSINNDLKEVDYNLNVNDWPSKCLVKRDNIYYSVSKWVSPKRTRSYPFSRVYETFSYVGGKRITIIPIVKDEGLDGDRDYLQWATIALMSLLNVYVIITYYTDGDKRKTKITNQKFDDLVIKNQIDELDNYHSSSLHWNLLQLKSENLKSLIDKVIYHYDLINKKTGVIFHNEKGLYNFREKIGDTIEEFKQFSNQKSIEAQSREIVTFQVNERLGLGEKMKIIIGNYLGGLYNLTIDDVIIEDGIFYLMECKNTNHSIIPSNDDIKDGLLKLILFTNIDLLTYKDNEVKFYPSLMLTSKKVIGRLKDTSNPSEIEEFCRINNLNKRKETFLFQLIKEVKENNIKLIIENNND